MRPSNAPGRECSRSWATSSSSPSRPRRKPNSPPRVVKVAEVRTTPPDSSNRSASRSATRIGARRTAQVGRSSFASSGRACASNQTTQAGSWRPNGAAQRAAGPRGHEWPGGGPRPHRAPRSVRGRSPRRGPATADRPRPVRHRAISRCGRATSSAWVLAASFSADTACGAVIAPRVEPDVEGTRPAPGQRDCLRPGLANGRERPPRGIAYGGGPGPSDDARQQAFAVTGGQDLAQKDRKPCPRHFFTPGRCRRVLQFVRLVEQDTGELGEVSGRGRAHSARG